MPSAPKPVRQSNARIEARARSMEAALRGWMLRVARREAQQAIRGVVAKADSLDEELIQILIKFGVAQAKSGAMLGASGKDLKSIIDPQALSDAIRSKDFNIKLFDQWRDGAERRAGRISADTKDMVREQLRTIMAEAADEDPRPSQGEIARRIRNQFYGEADGRAYAFSPERAAVISRTELVQAENFGINESYKAAGVETIEWLAYNDGRSGDRHHERMNGKRIKMGETFITPLGNALEFPGDPAAPIEDTIQCRCTIRAVIA